MASSSSQALAKRSAEDALMLPPPLPTKRVKRPATVLDEDVYTDALSHIIARDYFPGLQETEAQEAYLDALNSKNKDWIREAGRNMAQAMTPGPNGRSRQRRGTSFTPRRSTAEGETPRGWKGETPGRTPMTEAGGDHFAPEEKPEVDVNMSLGAFQAKYTSEDNESFYSLLDNQNEKRAAKYAFFHTGNKLPSNRQIAQREIQQKLIESGMSSGSTALIRNNADGEERRLLSADGPSQDLDARPASVDSFPNRTGPRNTLMFGPDSVEDSVTTQAQLHQMRSIAAPKATNYAGTRFAPEIQETIPASPSMSAIDAAIAGRPKPTESEPGYTGAETPRVNGYAFVDAEPTPSELGQPVSDAEAEAAEREAMLALLPRADDSGPNAFKIQESSKREDLLHRLVEKSDQARRKGGKSRVDQLSKLGITPGRTPTPRFKSAEGLKSGKAGMTPAARSLAEKLRTPRKGW